MNITLSNTLIEKLNKVAESFINKEYLYIFQYIQTFLLIYFALLIIVFVISLFFIFKKEDINPCFALIPFYNIYLYFKLLDFPFVYFFIPIVNIIVLLTLPYNLAYNFGLKRFQCVLTLFFPLIMIPYIAFSDKHKYHKITEQAFVKTPADIDKLENKLSTNNPNYSFEDSINSVISTQENDYISKIDEKINKIEENSLSTDYSDELYFKDELEKDVNKDTIQTFNKDMIQDDELIDLFGNNIDMQINGIDKIENQIENTSKLDTDNDAEYKEYNNLKKDNELIAFGGSNYDEKVKTAKSEAKVNILKCPHCGSSLVGSNGSCPGCGRKVNSLIFNSKNL